jgi:enamine deaminase RidA (YjgF/YER057c/UK114 family)
MTARKSQVIVLRVAAAAWLLAAGGYAVAQSGAPQKKEAAAEKQFINPPGIATPRGYTHVVIVPSGKTIFIAGQVALNTKGEIVGKGDLRAQAAQVYENLKTALAAAGATFADVVKVNTYIVNLKPEHLPVLREVRSGYFPQQNPPASTLVGVTALANPDFLIEVEAIAAVK